MYHRRMEVQYKLWQIGNYWNSIHVKLEVRFRIFEFWFFRTFEFWNFLHFIYVWVRVWVGVSVWVWVWGLWALMWVRVWVVWVDGCVCWWMAVSGCGCMGGLVCSGFCVGIWISATSPPTHPGDNSKLWTMNKIIIRKFKSSKKSKFENSKID
jgi:hypothetical protein